MPLNDKPRICAVDLARGLAALFMICVHVQITFSTADAQSSAVGKLIDFLGEAPAAPVFMAMMGVSFYFTRRTEFWPGVLRGLKIVMLGYLLNLLRGVVPVLLAKSFAPESYARIPAAVLDLSDALLELDILQFAGLSLIVMAVLRKLAAGKWLLLALAAVVGLSAPSLWNVQCGVPLLDHFLDYLWGDKPSNVECVGNLVSFPFFPWFSYVLLGMFIGDALSKSDDLERTFRKIGIAGLAVMAVGRLCSIPSYAFQLNDYYHTRPGAVLFICGFVMAWLYVCDFAVRRFKPNRLFELLFHWSRNINMIYIIQWVLIMLAADAFIGFNNRSTSVCLALMAGAVLATHLLNDLYLRLTAEPRKG